ncbi:E3 ubiquitin-protein ligase Rnf220 [Eupeodes corollae]|uniref:E3 ubiquitin-protein ligase Rnf220 n=1 Tax=Eupeodes corollae TaxID=290404 RepID=UPI002491811F|nr:E3 ubiquitin-protein ligase Rnf220 [Eupeodes corollae]
MNKNKKLRNEMKALTWEIYQRVKKNRQSRSETRLRKMSPRGTSEQNNENSLQQINNNIQIDEAMDDNIEEYEEYEWAGQKRIRVSSLIPGGYASIGIGTSISNSEYEGEDLNVDDDDTHIYGPPQYSESDVISSTSTKNDSSNESSTQSQTNTTSETESAKSSNSKEQTSEEHTKKQEKELTELQCSRQIIDSLKDKLRKYENHTQNKFKCLICLEDYHNPAISVSCWHVHCEQCWLRSLGARKLCPQCNLITSPSDLRRIYM